VAQLGLDRGRRSPACFNSNRRLISYILGWLLISHDAVACLNSVILLMPRHTHLPGTGYWWRIARACPNSTVRL
jgi:hypothetical protein